MTNLPPFLDQRGEYTLTCDASRIDPVRVHELLHAYTYWANERPLEVVERSLAHSLNFGLFHGDVLVGFARAVTDYATYAWICDVVVIPEERGRGLGKWLVQSIVAHPDLQGLRLVLRTRDAHELYRVYGGFDLAGKPENMLERRTP